MEHAAVVQQVGDKERNAGMAAHQRLGILMYRRVHTDVRLALEKLRAKGALLGQR
jgi:hypothetical protein